MIDLSHHINTRLWVGITSQNRLIYAAKNGSHNYVAMIITHLTIISVQLVLCSSHRALHYDIAHATALFDHHQSLIIMTRRELWPKLFISPTAFDNWLLCYWVSLIELFWQSFKQRLTIEIKNLGSEIDSYEIWLAFV